MVVDKATDLTSKGEEAVTMVTRKGAAVTMTTKRVPALAMTGDEGGDTMKIGDVEVIRTGGAILQVVSPLFLLIKRPVRDAYLFSPKFD